MRTVYGIVCTEHGLAGNRAANWQTPSSEVCRIQDPEIPVDLNHDRVKVGEVVDLQRRHGNIWCIAEVSDHVTPSVAVRVGSELRHVDTDLYWSASRIGSSDLGYVFDGISLTRSPARVSARPVTFVDGNVALAAYRSHDRFQRQLLGDASEARLSRGLGSPIVIRDNDLHAQLAQRMHPTEFFAAAEDLAWEGRPAGQPIVRPGTILSVR